MFDFDRWRGWLTRKTDELRQQGVDAEFLGGDEPTEAAPMPAHTFRLRTGTALAQLNVWATGECDYDIMNARSKEFVEHSWGMVLDDGSFAAAFKQFLERARQVS